MDYDLKIIQNEKGFWYICSDGYILYGFGYFEYREQAERVINNMLKDVLPYKAY